MYRLPLCLILSALTLSLSAKPPASAERPSSSRSLLRDTFRNAPPPEWPALAVGLLGTAEDKHRTGEEILAFIARERPVMVDIITTSMLRAQPTLATRFSDFASELPLETRSDFGRALEEFRATQENAPASTKTLRNEHSNAAQTGPKPSTPPANRPSVTPGNSEGNRPTTPPGHVRDPKPGREPQRRGRYAHP